MQRNNDDSASTGKSRTSGFSAARSEEQASKSIAIDIPQISLPKGYRTIEGIDEKFTLGSDTFMSVWVEYLEPDSMITKIYLNSSKPLNPYLHGQ